EDVEGLRYVRRRFTTPGSLPMGYHRLILERGDDTAEMVLLSAPLRAFEPTQNDQGQSWGVFLPLYALHTERSWGAGDFTDLETLSDWITELGGGIIATLPLLASFLDEPFEPGPYSPASRLFWNEFYLDIERIPEFSRSRAAQTLLNSADFRQELAQ